MHTKPVGSGQTQSLHVKAKKQLPGLSVTWQENGSQYRGPSGFDRLSGIRTAQFPKPMQDMGVLSILPNML